MEAFDMATFDDRDFKQMFNFLLQFKWVHDLHLTKFLESRVWEKIPDDWNELFSAMTLEELNCLPFHKADSQPKESANSLVPESLRAFLQKSSALSHDRRQAKDSLPHPTEVSRDLSKGMSPKKLHEVEWMASLVNQVAVEAECSVVVDVGSGLGYLGQVLHKNYGLRVIGLESSAGHSEGAEKRAAKQGLNCSGVRSIPFLITDKEDNVQEFCSMVRHIAASFHPCEHSPSFKPSRSVTTDSATRGGQPFQPLSNKPETSETSCCENKVMAGGDRRRYGVTGGTEHGCVESCACKIFDESSRVNSECGETWAEVHDKVATQRGASRSVGLTETDMCCDFNESEPVVCSLPFGWQQLSVRAPQPRSATSVGSGEEKTARTSELKFKQTSTEVRDNRDNSATKSVVKLGSGDEETKRTGEHTFDRTSEGDSNCAIKSAFKLHLGKEETKKTDECNLTSEDDNNKPKSAFKLHSGKEETKRTDECNFEQSSKVMDNDTSHILTGSRFHNVSAVMQRGGSISDNDPQAPGASHSLCFSSHSNTDRRNNSSVHLDTDVTGSPSYSSRMDKDCRDGRKLCVSSMSFPSHSNTDNKNNSHLQTTEETGSPNFSSRMDKDCRDGRKLCVSSMSFPSHSNTGSRNNSSVQSTDETGCTITTNYSSRMDKDSGNGKNNSSVLATDETGCHNFSSTMDKVGGDGKNISSVLVTDETGCHNFSSRTNEDDGVGNDKSSVQDGDTPGSPNYSSRVDKDCGNGKNISSVLVTDETGCTNFSSRMDKHNGNGKNISSVLATDETGCANFSSRTDKDDGKNNSSVLATDETSCTNFSSRTDKDDGKNNSSVLDIDETGCTNFSSRTDKDDDDGKNISSVQATDETGCTNVSSRMDKVGGDGKNKSSVLATDETGCTNFSSRTDKDDGKKISSVLATDETDCTSISSRTDKDDGKNKSSVQATDETGCTNFSSRMDKDGGKKISSVLATDETGCASISSKTDKDDGKKSSVPARDVKDLRVCLIGLHCCGDLTTAMLRLYHRVDFLRAICCVSCCYHKMKLQPDCDQFINFPMSAAAKRSYNTVCADRKPALPTTPAPTTFLSPCSLRLAAQETRTRWSSQNKADHDSHARHVGYRAILELFFGERRLPGQDRKSVRRLDYNNFNHFVESYLASANICDVGEQESTREMLMALHKKFEPYFKHIEPYTCLQVILQPVLESTILWDRQQWLTEQGLSAVVMPIFDQHISPRNMALLSKKI